MKFKSKSEIYMAHKHHNFVMFTRNLVIHIIKMLQSIFVFAAKVPSVGGEYGFFSGTTQCYKSSVARVRTIKSDEECESTVLS